MRIVCQQQSFKTALDTVMRAVPSRPSHPILAMVKVDLLDGEIRLTGFDLSFGLQTTIEADVSGEGSIMLPGKLVSDIVGKLDDLPVVIEEDPDVENHHILTSGFSRFEIASMSAEEFPSISKVDGTNLTLPGSVLKQAIDSTLYAASTDETKQILTGLCLVLESSGEDKTLLELAATDGHRLAIAKNVIDGQLPETRITIPYRIMGEIAKMADEDDVTILFDDCSISAISGKNALVGRLLDGSYPNYRALIPESFKHTVTIDRKACAKSVELVGLLAETKNNVVIVDVIPAAQQVQFSASSADAGRGSHKAQAQIQGNPIRTSFNTKYVKDALKHLGSAEVQLQMNGPTQPAVITPLSGEDVLTLLMPVHIRQ